MRHRQFLKNPFLYTNQLCRREGQLLVPVHGCPLGESDEEPPRDVVHGPPVITALLTIFPFAGRTMGLASLLEGSKDCIGRR
jgi:hypothetical protein